MMNILFNNSVNFNNSNNYLCLKTWINIWTLLNTILAMIISLFFIIYVVRIYISKKSFHVSLILTCNTCLTIICSSITFSLISLSSIGGDYNIISLKQIIFYGCHIRGYLTYVFLISMYLSYILQACYRLFRIVYYKYKYLRTMSTFSYYLLIQWILSFIFTLPILFANKNCSSFIVYLPENFNCLVPFTNIRGVIFSALIIYVSPICGLCLIYSRIIIHIRHKRRRTLSILKFRRQNKRDTSVIKRIYTVLIILLALGFPIILFLIVFLITGNLHWITYRICWMAVSVSLVFISLSSLYVTPEIYKKLQILFGCSKPHKKYHRASYSINMNIEREKKIESLFLENTSSTVPNILT